MRAALDLTHASWQQFSRLLDQALELPPAERAAWVDALDGEHDALKPALRAVVARASAADSAQWLDTLPHTQGAPTIDAESDLRPGALVGPYRLIRELAAGGMGMVWLAERADATLKRRVALKLPHAIWSPGLAQRMARERDILAALEHPNIARLYDAGTDAQGRPFLALEYVEGQPIDAYCRERGLNVRQRVQLLLQVAHAVAFAHSRLVIHRDLKPGNILVTSDGQVRLLDFGIAKLMEGESAKETQLTQMAGRALTLDYASPEQIRGEAIGTASDVYSLGVVAYELLSGARPYKLKRQTAAQLEEAIAAIDAPLASAVAADATNQRALKGDLDAILNKALKKDPADRYATVDGLAADFLRWMRCEAVHARPDRRWYRARRFIRRNRLPVGAAAIVSLALVVGTVVALWQAQRAREQTRVAQTEAKTAAAVQDFLEGIFRVNSGDQADPMRARRRTALELLDEGAARIEKELDDVPAAKIRVLRTLAELYLGMGHYDRVTRLLEQRLALAERSDPGGGAGQVQALVELGNQMSRVDRPDDALRLLTQAETLLRRLPRLDDDTRIAFDLAWADYYSRRADARGIDAARRAADLLGLRPPSLDLVRALMLQGDLQRTTGKPADAVVSLRQAIAVSDRLPGGGGAARVAPLLQLALSEAASGDHAAAEATMREGVRVAEQTVGFASTWTVNMLSNLGQMMARDDRLREALEVLRDARARQQQLPESPDKAQIAKSILFVEAPLERVFGRPERSLELHDQWDALQRSAVSHPNEVASMLSWRAATLTDLGQLAEARRALDRATSLRAQNGLHNFGGVVNAAQADIALALAEGDARRAREALQRWADHPLATRQRRPELLAATAEVRLAAEGAAAAAAAAESGLAELARPEAAGSAAASRFRLQLVFARALLAQGQAEEAARQAAQALAANASMCDVAQSPDRLLALTVLGHAHLALHDRAAAQRAFDEAQAIRRRHARLGPQYVAPLERLRALLASGAAQGGRRA